MDLPPRPRRTTSEARIAAYQANRAGPVRLPPHLSVRPEALPFLNSVLAERPADEWVATDVVLAVQAAELMALIHSMMKDATHQKQQRRIEEMQRLELRILRNLRILGSRRVMRARVTPVAARSLLAD